MKLIYCKECGDVVRLRKKERTCDKECCGKSGGWYKDSQTVIIFGPCVPLGFKREEFEWALERRPSSGKGREFLAFVIPRRCWVIIHFATEEAAKAAEKIAA